jgi:hypothetical protein
MIVTWVFVARGNVFIESLRSNERIFCLHYSGFQVSCHNFAIVQIRNCFIRSSRLKRLRILL